MGSKAPQLTSVLVSICAFGASSFVFDELKHRKLVVCGCVCQTMTLTYFDSGQGWPSGLL